MPGGANFFVFEGSLMKLGDIIDLYECKSVLLVILWRYDASTSSIFEQNLSLREREALELGLILRENVRVRAIISIKYIILFN